MPIKKNQTFYYQNLHMSILGHFWRLKPTMFAVPMDQQQEHLDEDQMHYLSTRGLMEVESRQLLLKGFIDDVFQRMQTLGCSESDRIRSNILNYAHVSNDTK